MVMTTAVDEAVAEQADAARLTEAVSDSPGASVNEIAYQDSTLLHICTVVTVLCGPAEEVGRALRVV